MFVGRGSFELSKYIRLLQHYVRTEFHNNYVISAYTCEVVGTHDTAEVERLSFGKYKLNSVLSQYMIVLIKKLAVAQLVKINSRLLCNAKVRRTIYDSLPLGPA